MLAYDIGMNVGQSSLHYLQRGFHVVAVEPNPFLISAAQKRLKPFLSNITILENAISSTSGRKHFCLDGPSVGNHLVFTKEDGSCQTRRTVKTTTCKKILNEFGKAFIVKIDIEGMELDCLESIIQARFMPCMITFENPLRKCHHCRTRFLKIVRMLNNLGFSHWKRQSWAKQFGHRFIGDEVIDIKYNKTWINASTVSREFCCGTQNCDYVAKANKYC